MPTFACKQQQIAPIVTALVNDAVSIGLGILHDHDAGLAAIALLCEQDFDRGREPGFDYVHGRPIKVYFHHQDDDTWTFDTELYDRDQGRGHGERVLESFKLEKV